MAVPNGNVSARSLLELPFSNVTPDFRDDSDLYMGNIDRGHDRFPARIAGHQHIDR